MPRSRLAIPLTESKGAAAIERRPGSLLERQMVVVVALVAALVYVNTLANGFVLDDNAIIGHNVVVHHISGLWRSLSVSYWPAGMPGGQYRPLTLAGFTLQWLTGHGSPFVFHLVNIGWHVAVCVLVWQLLGEWHTPTGALVGALLFAVHPVHVEAVANGVGQSDLMCSAFVLTGLLGHRRGQWWAVPCFAAALFTKESGIVMVGLAVLSDLMRPASDGVTPRKRLALYGGYGLTIAVFAVAFFTVLPRGGVEASAAIWHRASITERWLTMISVIPIYLRLMVAPFWLSIEYGPRDIMLVDHVTGSLIVGGILLLAAIVATVWAWRRAPAVAFGLIWFAMTLSPVANIVFPSGVVIAERTLYLPSVGAMMVMGWLLERVIAVRPRVWQVACGLLVVAWAVRTWTRSTVWHDDKRLVLQSLHEDPLSARGHYRAAQVLGGIGYSAAAAREMAISDSLFSVPPATNP